MTDIDRLCWLNHRVPEGATCPTCGVRRETREDRQRDLMRILRHEA